MNLLFHQLRKDLRHSRVLVGLWLILVVARFALVGWNADPGDMAMQSVYTMVSILTLILGYLLVLVLVPQVIHQEPLVGTTAFWFTRPLSRTTLLGAKALFFLLLIALSIVVQTIVFLVNGVTLHDVALAVPEIILSQASWILTLTALAVLTPNAGRFIVMGAVILVAIYILAFVVQILRLFHFDLTELGVDASLVGSRTVVSDLILIGFGLAVAINQYLTRQTRRSIILALVGLLGSQMASNYWAWNFLKPSVKIANDSQFHVDVIGTPSLTSSLDVSDEPSFRGGDPTKQIRGTVAVPGCPAGYLVKINDIDSTLKTKAGKEIQTNRPFNAVSFYYGQSAPGPIERALGGATVLNIRGSSDDIATVLFALSANDYRENESSDLDYTGRVNGCVYKYTSTTELPIAKGGRFVHGSDRETIVNVLKQSQGVDIQLQIQSVHLLLAPTSDDNQNFMRNPNQRDVLYVLLNRKRHEAVVQKQDSSFNISGFSGQEILSHKPLRISFGPDNNDPQGSRLSELNQAWIDDAVLVRMELVPVAEFTRTLTAPHFRLDGSFHGANVPAAETVADPDALDKITLPTPATREQTRDYIQSILHASAGTSEFNDHDPQIRMLEQVGSQNVDLLIDLARTSHNYDLNLAIRDLAQDDQRDAVLQALPTNHDLIDTIVAHHWEKEAGPTLLAALSDPKLDRADAYATALISLKDPATYDALKTYCAQHPDQRLFDALATLPDFDLKATIDAAWQDHAHEQPWEIRSMLASAFQFNEPEVLDVTVGLLDARNDAYTRKMARKALTAYTPAVGADDKELIAWVEANKANLAFDPIAKKFTLKTPDPAPATTPDPTSPAPK